ncbi:MAG: 1-acyl-sn-glycerol-3-phosphate acyltransferase [Lachnospiraceae bacterium]|nr:1-acyl-sn-glycerol-3-phosphate acyltransferase [Lachnospiraceae bacterium]
MIRIVIALIVVILFFTVSFFLILPAEWLLGRFNPKAKEDSSLAIVKWAFRTVMFIAGCKPKVIGLEQVPKDEAVLYVANHLSFFDIIITYSLVPGQTCYISKKENRVPILAQYMKNLHCLFLDRKDIRQGMQIILQAIQFVKDDGISVFIFPEGTRSRTGELLPFKEGSFKIASKSGCKIVPVAITGSSAIFEDHFPLLKKGEVIVEYGKPFTIRELSPEDQKFPGRYTHDLIASMKENHASLLS